MKMRISQGNQSPGGLAVNAAISIAFVQFAKGYPKFPGAVLEVWTPDLKTMVGSATSDLTGVSAVLVAPGTYIAKFRLPAGCFVNGTATTSAQMGPIAVNAGQTYVLTHVNVGGAPIVQPYGPIGLGMVDADISFQDRFTTGQPDPAVWTKSLPFGNPGKRNEGFAGVFVDETVQASDKSTWNPFAGGKPGMLSMGVKTLPTGVTIPGYATCQYLASVISSHNSFWQKYGYFEWTCQGIPGGTENAFYGYDQASVAKQLSPAYELDFQEMYGTAPSHWNLSQHYDLRDGKGKHNMGNYTACPTGTDFTKGQVKQGVLWTPQGLTRFLNDVQIDAKPLPLAPNPLAIYLVLAADVDWAAPHAPWWYENNSVPSHFASGAALLVSNVTVLRTKDTTEIGGTAARITL